MTSSIILCADDYAMTESVSTGITELVQDGRLSATSAMVTTRHWPAQAATLKALREQAAIGLHFNLTLGQPLGAMPWLCPTGTFPLVSAVIRSSLARHIEPDEVAGELGRQLDAFETAMGVAPDFIDGHQHVHALPVVRAAVLRVLQARYAGRRLLIRDPADSAVAILGRGGAVKKALLLATIARGFGDAVRAAGFIANSSFAGVSAFDETKSFRGELDRFFARASACHLVMCHPGYVDDELPTLDPVVARRVAELQALKAYAELPARLWHAMRSADGQVIWPGVAPDVTHG
jgi:chitin disaccharide deacetylase